MSNMDLGRVIHDQTSFTLDLYKQVWQEIKPESVKEGSDESTEQKNAVLSPVSISVALAMAAAGAKGQTVEQICSVLKLPTGPLMHNFLQQLNSVLLGSTSALKGFLKLIFRRDKEKELVCSVANGMWVEESLKLKASYTNTIKRQYRAEARTADFIKKAEDSRKMINSWVSGKTNGKIQELLPEGSVDNQSRLVLTNAIYFKGAWQKEFDKTATEDGPFILPNGETIQVPMMTTRKKQFLKNHGSFKVLRLPYHPGSDTRAFSLYVLLPNERNGLPKLVKSLESAEFLESKLTDIGEVAVGRFQLPKFKISEDIDVQKVLTDLGLDLPFSAHQADFSDMVQSASRELYISNVFHKAFVEVNEQGTEAAAASGVTMTLRSINLDPAEDFVADHPFLFLIREDTTRIVLFIGHVDNPST